MPIDAPRIGALERTPSGTFQQFGLRARPGDTPLCSQVQKCWCEGGQIQKCWLKTKRRVVSMVSWIAETNHKISQLDQET
jgi:hypothetical protein